MQNRTHGRKYCILLKEEAFNRKKKKSECKGKIKMQIGHMQARMQNRTCAKIIPSCLKSNLRLAEDGKGMMIMIIIT